MRTVSRHTTFYDLLDALAKPGCAVCTLVSRTRWRYLDSLAYENVNDPGVRARLRGAHGFCNRHAWYFVDVIREVFGAAIIYRDILHTIQAATASPARGIPEPSSRCPACVAEDESGDYAIHTLAETIDEPEMRSAVAGSDGLCGLHLLRAMRVLRPALRPKVLETTLTRWQERDAASGLRARATGAPGLFSTDRSALVGPVGGGPSIRPATASDAFTCSVCVALRGEFGRFHSWTLLDDGVGGLCNVHAWMPQGNDCEVVYRRQIATIGGRASSLSGAPGGDWLRNAMRNLGLSQPDPDPPPVISCFVCAHQAASEALLCGQADAPLCIPHLRRALATRGIGPLEALQPIWRELDVLLGEYLRKEDYRFRSEPRGIEQKSPRWVVSLMAGAVGIR